MVFGNGGTTVGKYGLEVGMCFYFGLAGSYRRIEQVSSDGITFRVVHGGKRPDKRTKTVRKQSFIAWAKRHGVKFPARCLCGESREVK